MKFVVRKSTLQGTAQIPGNKSATARAIVPGGLAVGVSETSNPLSGLDNFSIIGMMQALCAKVDTSDLQEWIFEGVANKPQVPNCVLDAGNSGTSYYFLSRKSASTSSVVLQKIFCF
jgi:3-phosphoshikimate 1-carboxyvinyltransferase